MGVETSLTAGFGFGAEGEPKALVAYLNLPAIFDDEDADAALAELGMPSLKFYRGGADFIGEPNWQILVKSTLHHLDGDRPALVSFSSAPSGGELNQLLELHSLLSLHHSTSPVGWILSVNVF